MKALFVALMLAICGLAVAAPPAESHRDGKLVAYFDCSTGKKVADERTISTATRKERIRLAAAGFCELHENPNGTHYCEKGTCSGSCKLNNYPASCSCD